MMKTTSKVLLVFGVLVVIGIVAMVLSVPRTATAPQACTTEARLCPDGSAVGRTGPNCEFAACPSATTTINANTNSDWSMFTDSENGFSFQYPAVIGTTYISPTDWPPKVTLHDGSFSCKEGGTEIASGGVVEERTIGGKVYCVTTASEGAAGSVYTTYTYQTEESGKLATMNMTLRFVQCFNYDDPKKSACVQERQAFDSDQLAAEVFDSMIIIAR